MLALLLSLAALAVGPLVHSLVRRRHAPLAALEGFLLTAVGGLALIHIIPEGVRRGGWIALLVAVVGLLGPEVVERLLVRAAGPAHLLALSFALLGLAAHAALDGAALAGGRAGHLGSSATEITFAVVLHRIPDGLMAWWLLQGLPGSRRLAVATLLLMGVATLVGFGLEARLVEGLSPRGVALFQSLVAGTLLHVLLHRPHATAAHAHRHDEEADEPGHAHPRWQLSPAAVAGGLCGVALVAALSLEEC